MKPMWKLKTLTSGERNKIYTQPKIPIFYTYNK